MNIVLIRNLCIRITINGIRSNFLVIRREKVIKIHQTIGHFIVKKVLSLRKGIEDGFFQGGLFESQRVGKEIHFDIGEATLFGI